MSREAKLIIFSLILIASIAIKFGGVLDSFSNDNSTKETVKKNPSTSINNKIVILTDQYQIYHSEHDSNSKI